MSTNVIILCQGQQTRLPMLDGPKQLLPLVGCNGATLLDRTLRQIDTLMASDRESIVNVIGGEPFRRHLSNKYTPPCPSDLGNSRRIRHIELASPGNSSLLGVFEVLRLRDQWWLRDYFEYEHIKDGSTCGRADKIDKTVVLLGDVLYSWRCLASLLAHDRYQEKILFVGTHDLSTSGGELWGVAYSMSAHMKMMEYAAAALVKHPPFEDYQPGQLRRWYWAARNGRTVAQMLSPAAPAMEFTPGRYFLACGGDPSEVPDVRDYTMDVDVPEHLMLLEEASFKASHDDFKHGVTW